MTVVVTREQHTRLLTWFDRAIADGIFKVPSGRHIVLNDRPRLIRIARYKASAGVPEDVLIAFFADLNPKIGTIHSPKSTAEDVLDEPADESMISLCRCADQTTALALAGVWHVATPPLAALRRAWSSRRIGFDVEPRALPRSSAFNPPTLAQAGAAFV